MKKLYRSRNHRVIAGIGGGMGDYFDIDPVFIRILFVITVFTGGAGLLAYIILWIVVPNEPFEFAKDKNNTYSENPNSESAFSEMRGENWVAGENVSEIIEKPENKGKIRTLGGILLIILGLVILLDNIVPDFDFTYVWSIILILIGFFIILKNKNIG
ncbi:MAG: hypothetical protein A2X64_06085 [Ignavibacteria bacterium GWF2_33_9]|nr:MAG: hypothetical protein A2X64_06085 [Ignavibacteria bacterium GWF2_33_9]